MEIEERLERLEDAHRELTAQHIALWQVCMATLPLISAPQQRIRSALLQAYDSLNEHMDTHDMDDTYQQAARERLDGLIAAILKGAEYMRARQQPGP